MKLITLLELAQRMRSTRNALLCRRNRNPKSLPPPVRLPGDPRLLFDEKLVARWLRSNKKKG